MNSLSYTCLSSQILKILSTLALMLMSLQSQHNHFLNCLLICSHTILCIKYKYNTNNNYNTICRHTIFWIIEEMCWFCHKVWQHCQGRGELRLSFPNYHIKGQIQCKWIEYFALLISTTAFMLRLLDVVDRQSSKHVKTSPKKDLMQ